MASRSNVWKKNKLLTTFLRTKRKQNKRSTRPYQVAKRFKPAFSLLPDGDQIGKHSHEPDHNPGWINDHDGGNSDVEHSSTEEIEKTKRQPRSHGSMKAKQLESWTKAQANLIHCYTTTMGMNDGQLCMECSNVAQFRCRDCSAGAFYCKNCCVKVHCYNNMYHFPEKWVNSKFILAPLKSTIPLTHSCSTTYQRKITVVSTQGQHHGQHVTFCGCSSIVERLFMCGLWPATPNNPTLAFTLDLMNKIHYLVLECQTSLRDIASFLKLTGRSQPEDKEFYKQLTVTFPQYRCFKSAIRRSVHMVTSVCPACPKQESFDPMFVAVDANFRLCRRAKAGRTCANDSPLIQPTLFLPQEKVDTYVKSEQRRPVESNCSEFKAGDALRSHSRYCGLDETAVFGAVCRHDLPLRMLSLKHGERIAYADFLLSSMVDQGVLSQAVKVTYDIGCKLEAHWKRYPDKFQSLLLRCDVAVPIFHAYAHEASCQYRFSPRNLEGFGLLDGENIERLWSYLGRFSRMTKEMSSANRIDLLTDALSHYCSLKRTRLEKACVDRYTNAVKQLKLAEDELSSILRVSGIDTADFDQIEHHLRMDEESRLRGTGENENDISWRVKYVRLLEKSNNMSDKLRKVLVHLHSSDLSAELISETIDQLSQQEQTVQRFEMEIGVTSRWDPSMEEYTEALAIANTTIQQHLKVEMLEAAKERIFYLNTLTHHAGGQKQANRVSKLITACSSKIKKLLVKYSDLQIHNGDVAQVSVKDVFDLKSQFWVTEHSYLSIEPHNTLSASSQRRLLDLHNLQQRANEEKQQVIGDLVRIIAYYSDLLNSCIRAIRNILIDYFDLSTTLTVDFENVYSIIEPYTLEMSPNKVGFISCILATFHEAYQTLRRAEEVTQLIVVAYWTNDVNAITKANKVASTSILPECSLSLQESDLWPYSDLDVEEAIATSHTGDDDQYWDTDTNCRSTDPDSEYSSSDDFNLST